MIFSFLAIFHVTKIKEAQEAYSLKSRCFLESTGSTISRSCASFANPAVKQSGKFNGDKVHMSKRGFSLARRILHMAALNNLKVDKGSGMPVNPVIHSYYAGKCRAKKKNVAVGAVMHKICNIIFAMLRDNKPFEIITPQEHCERYLAAHSAY